MVLELVGIMIGSAVNFTTVDGQEDVNCGVNGCIFERYKGVHAIGGRCVMSPKGTCHGPGYLCQTDKMCCSKTYVIVASCE